jgi:hypothetical protein
MESIQTAKRVLLVVKNALNNIDPNLFERVFGD